jgi:hypothetical protein
VWRDRLRGRQDVERAAEAVFVEDPERRLNVSDMLGRVDRLPEP